MLRRFVKINRTNKREEQHKFTNMMNGKFNQPYDPKKVEDKIYRLWEKSGYFNPDKLPSSKVKGQRSKVKSFCITVPPPNVTGTLHLGHALNATIQDILIRKKRMEGYRTLWLPGTDHAGIATQNVVEKELKKEGLTRHNLGKEKFLERIWQWKKKYGHIILDQFKKLGASMDWSRTRFTMDPDYQKAVKEAFIKYYEKGLIYRAERMINWCTRCHTSLSDLEVEYKPTESKLWFIKYSPQITVATTRPETMLGDTAVAVHPNDKRYKHLVGRKIVLPISSCGGSLSLRDISRRETEGRQNREIPIIADKRVDPKFGTGAVKVTPGHSFVDFEISQEHHLEIIKIINDDGKMTEQAGEDFQGLTILQAREKVLQELEKQGLIEKVEDYKNNIGHCYRCGTIIEPMLSQQWFLKMDGLARMAIKAVRSSEIRFHPKRWEKVYFNWLNNIKDWCISRQIWWGHQLPVWFCKNQTGISKSKFLISKQISTNYVVSLTKPKKCPICGNCEMEQSTDVLDTWFSSALWPFATLGWPIACAQNKKSKIKNKKRCIPKKGSDLERFYPTQILVTGRDIINLWVARMIFSGFEFMGKKPFKDVIIHATILTKEGKRMSKSLGTGIDPIILIENYGADATRFGLIWQAIKNQDIRWSEEHVIAGKKFCNKIWNATRFVLINTPSRIDADLKIIRNGSTRIKKLTSADKKIIAQLVKIKKSVEKDLDNFHFGEALHKLYHFFWHDFCDKYIETSKSQLANPKLKNNTQQILFYVLFESLKLIHPFMPFITEEIYQNLPIKNKKLLMIESW